MSTAMNHAGDKPPRDPGRHRGRLVRFVLITALALVLVAVGLIAGLNLRGPVSISQQLNCGSSPATCGYPSASSTGVPAGTVLRTVPGQVSKGTGWHYDSRGFVQVDGAGAVLNDLYIPFNVNIVASGVTISDVHVVAGGPDVIGISLRHTHDVTIKNTTISGIDTGSRRLMTGIKDVYGDSADTTILRNNISRFETGVQLDSGVIQDNYIHDPGYISGDHTNGVMSNGGTSLLSITHNTILNSRGQTDAIGLFEDFNTQASRSVTNNLVAGGAYAIYGGATKAALPTSDIVISGNRFSTIYYPKCGAYGRSRTSTRPGRATSGPATSGMPPVR
ncbi:MAG TPA: hypothetical protein VNF47_15285 [Streptosporangiaceae bacterium]|nr:hypothetical protein [Streptosporangiaceae bacterium]